LGANILLKALGEAGDDIPLTAAVAVSVPFQLQPCVECLNRGFPRVYQHALLTALKQMVRRRHGPVQPLPAADIEATLKARDFFAYDDAYTAPMNGYPNAREYYRRASCGQYLRGIRRPTLIVHALDDPFMVPSIVPSAQQLAPAVTLELSPRGDMSASSQRRTTAARCTGWTGASPGSWTKCTRNCRPECGIAPTLRCDKI
jgi:predicted alpha/beta-fold hydrolase